jgi:hypothetical protein
MLRLSIHAVREVIKVIPEAAAMDGPLGLRVRKALRLIEEDLPMKVGAFSVPAV